MSDAAPSTGGREIDETWDDEPGLMRPDTDDAAGDGDDEADVVPEAD